MTDKTNKTTAKDIAHSLVKGGLDAIPVVGSLATEIFGLIVTPPLEKRRAEWMNEIAAKLKELGEYSVHFDIGYKTAQRHLAAMKELDLIRDNREAPTSPNLKYVVND